MPHTYTVTASADSQVEDGVYPATLQDTEEMPELQYGPGIKFVFDLGDDITLSGICNDPDRLSPKTKLYQWACALLGLKELEIGASFDLDMLIGKPCRVQVENHEGSDGGTWSKITRVLPAKTAPKAVAKAGPKAAPKRDSVDEELRDL